MDFDNIKFDKWATQRGKMIKCKHLTIAKCYPCYRDRLCRMCFEYEMRQKVFCSSAAVVVKNG